MLTKIPRCTGCQFFFSLTAQRMQLIEAAASVTDKKLVRAWIQARLRAELYHRQFVHRTVISALKFAAPARYNWILLWLVR